jgi:hypothetical protein
MLLTPEFVYIHQPKTGGTFVTALLGRVFGTAMLDLNKHGTCAEIPASHRGLPIVATARNPYDRYYSQYAFGWFKEHPPREWFDMDMVRARYPRWPEVSFDQFVDGAIDGFRRMKTSPLAPEDQPGFHSEQFVRYYFREPERAYPRIDDVYIAARRFEEDMHRVRFLRMENLNRELHDLLVALGHPASKLGFILEEKKILPEGSRRGTADSWEAMFSPALKARVRRRERLLFAIFPDYDR